MTREAMLPENWLDVVVVGDFRCGRSGGWLLLLGHRGDGEAAEQHGESESYSHPTSPSGLVNESPPALPRWVNGLCASRVKTVSGARQVAQKPLNHRGKAGGGRSHILSGKGRRMALEKRRGVID